MQDLHTEYNRESMVQAKFQESLLVFHSHWENCYSHILKVLPSHIIAGSVGVVMRKGEEKRLEDLVNEIQKQSESVLNLEKEKSLCYNQ